MDRLTHEADFGLEEWEQTLYSVNSDQGGAYNILDIANHEGEEEFDEILKTISLGLKHYEDTGLTPSEIKELKERDTAKEPTKVSDSGVRYTDDYICPNCGKHFIGTGIAEFCYHCGQRLKWEEL